MTHIAGHPPTIGGLGPSYIMMSPLYSMAGYLYLDDGEGRPTDFRIFFINNTGYTFKKKESVGFHLELFPISAPPRGAKAKWAAIAYDLVPYGKHRDVEKSVMGNGKIEDARVEYIEKCAQSRSGLERTILNQTARFMRSQSFKLIYPEYKGDISKWIRNNVVDLETMTSRIIGCGSSRGNEIVVNDFEAFLQENLGGRKKK